MKRRLVESWNPWKARSRGAHRFLWTALFAVGLWLPAAAGGSPLVVASGTATISSTPTSGSYGTTVHVTGSGFAASESVFLYFDSTSSMRLAATTATSTGTIATAFTVGQATFGQHTLLAVGQSSGNVGSASFQILPAARPSSTTTAQNSAETLRAHGFAAGETVTARWMSQAGSILGAAIANSLGTAVIRFAVPLSPFGSYSIVAAGQSSGASATAHLSLVAALSVSPKLGVPGATAIVWGSGFDVSHTVTVYWNCGTIECTSSTVLATAVTNSLGDFGGVSVRIPSSAASGTFRIGGKEGTTGPFASSSFTVGSFALPAPTPCNSTVGACWSPPLNSRWQYQLSGTPNPSGGCLYPSTGFINTGITGTSFLGQTVSPSVFDIDIYQDGSCYTPNNYDVLNTAAVQALHNQGDKAIGYIDAGTAEDWRPDYPQYQSFNQSCGGCLLGNPVNGFTDEQWLNINDTQTGINPNTGQRETTRQFILDEVTARLNKLIQAGFDAVEFDNVDGYQNSTGFSISYQTQLLFNTALAILAHNAGLTVGLKNDLGQAANLKAYFDFAINEQCFEFQECNYPPPGYPDWIVAGKAIFQVEYNIAPASYCPMANSWDFNSIRKSINLYDKPWIPCR